MEVRIRLQKVGAAKKRYNFRVVAINKSNKRQGTHLEILGYYDPAKKPASIQIDRQRLDQWVKKGAQMSETVRSLLKKIKK